MKPGRYDITIYQRATFELLVTLPIDLDGHEVIAQVWEDKRRKKFADFTVSVLSTSSESSEIKLTIPASVTRTITKQGEWDLMVVYDNGVKQYWLEGDAKIDPGYTDNLP